MYATSVIPCSIEGDFRMLKRAAEGNMRLPDLDGYPRYARKRERLSRNPIGEVLEVSNVSAAHRASHEIVQFAVIQYACRTMRARLPGDPYGQVDFNRLRNFRFVRKHAYVRVKTHRLQCDDVLLLHSLVIECGAK